MSYCYSSHACVWICEAVNIYCVYLYVFERTVAIARSGSLLMADYLPLAFKQRLQYRSLSHLGMPHIKLGEWLFTTALL